MALHGWLPSVIQLLKPYISSEDIAKGTRGMAAISEGLENSSFGIICLTKDNIHAPWLNFEAGALSKSVERSRVAPFLFGVDVLEIREGPLFQFQASRFDKDDVKKLLDSLNTAGAAPLLREDLLNDAFDTLWPRLEDRLNEIRGSEPEAKEGAPSSQGKGTDTSLHEVKNLVAGIGEQLGKQLAELTAEVASKKPDEAASTVARVQGDPAASLIDKAIASAVQLQRQEKIEEAIEQWRSIATVAGEEDRPLQARAWFSIGYLRSVGEGIDLEAAMDAYTKAIELNPTDADAYNNRGNAKDALGQHDAAVADLDRAIELNPTDADAYNNRGVVKRALGQHDAAVADYDRAIELNPTYAFAYNNRGNAKDALGQHDAAVADLDRAIELNPTDADAYYNRGNVKDALGQHDAAVADLDRAIELNPTYAFAYNNRGVVKRALGQHDAAVADYDRAIELNPTDADAYNNRGNVKDALGQHDAAIADYRQALVLAQEARDEKLVAAVKDALRRLDNR